MKVGESPPLWVLEERGKGFAGSLSSRCGRWERCKDGNQVCVSVCRVRCL